MHLAQVVLRPGLRLDAGTGAQTHGGVDVGAVEQGGFVTQQLAQPEGDLGGLDEALLGLRGVEGLALLGGHVLQGAGVEHGGLDGARG